MLKLWLVKFSNGEEWHVFGERGEVMFSSAYYATVNNFTAPEITFLRAYRSK